MFAPGHVDRAHAPDERAKLEHRLEECKVVLIRTLISDQLRYINIAKEWFTAADLADIRQRKIGFGRIGGKAARYAAGCASAKSGMYRRHPFVDEDRRVLFYRRR